MIVYFAGERNFRSGFIPENFIENKLYSYHWEQRAARKWPRRLMLDSGAFTAFTKGVTIDIDEYIAFVKEVKPHYAIQLDVIGNEEDTWKNYVYQAERVPCMPVIHYKASEAHIRRVLDASEYICLGGLVPHAGRFKTLNPWLDYIFSFPEVRKKRIHALGITTQQTLLRYPFYSCDSSSWIGSVRYAYVLSFVGDKLVMNTRPARRKEGKITPADMRLERTHKDQWLISSIKAMLSFEEYVTRVWETRGITWEPEPTIPYEQEK